MATVKPTFDELCTLVRTISAGRDVDTEKIARSLFSVPMREMTFEEFGVDFRGFERFTLAELDVTMECGKVLVEAARRAIRDRSREAQN